MNNAALGAIGGAIAGALGALVATKTSTERAEDALNARFFDPARRPLGAPGASTSLTGCAPGASAVTLAGTWASFCLAPADKAVYEAEAAAIARKRNTTVLLATLAGAAAGAVAGNALLIKPAPRAQTAR